MRKPTNEKKRQKKRRKHRFLVEKRKKKRERKINRKRSSELKRSSYFEETNNTHAKGKYFSKVPNKKKKEGRQDSPQNWPQVVAPTNFSLTKNPSGALTFFDTLIKKEARKNAVFIDLSQVESITIDSLLYLLTLTGEFRENRRCQIQGNTPEKEKPKQLVEESGFLSRIDPTIGKLAASSDFVQICDGKTVDGKMATNMCQFAMQKLNVERKEIKALRGMILEIIENSGLHAYEEREKLPLWYAYARFEPENKSITFSILDTGMGIPKTIRQNWFEKIPIIRSESDLLLSALQGQNRTSTRLSHRGKGLPLIYEACLSGYVKSFVLMSNRGYININSVDESSDLSSKLKGTLFSWKVTENSLIQGTIKMEKKTINIAKDFSDDPGGRYIRKGPFSGELFREMYLVPAIKAKYKQIEVILDGTFGYMNSFLEESFGGLARPYKGNETESLEPREAYDSSALLKLFSIISEEQPSKIEEVQEHIKHGALKKGEN